MIGQKITKRLSELQMSQYELAKRTGFSRGYISLLCKGERGGRVSLETAQKLGVPLQVEVLFFSKDENVATKAENSDGMRSRDGERAEL